MEIVKFRVKNYRSIIDSNDCYLTNKITILAGKNESGKTALLEALEDFNVDKEIRNEAIPIQNKKATPEIFITFKIGKDILNNVLDEIGLTERVKSGIDLEITKRFPNTYSISENFISETHLQDDSQLKKEITEKINTINTICQKYPDLGTQFPPFDIEAIEKLKTTISNFESIVTPNLSYIEDGAASKEFTDSLQILKADSITISQLKNINEVFLNTLKKNYLPYFILFNSFDDIFPNKIPLTELKDNVWIQDLSVISELNDDLINSSDDSGKEMHRDNVNIKLNNDYKKFWTQDITNLTVTWDNQYLYFWIKEAGYPYAPHLRSKGRQWHLAFYIKVSARAKENIPNIILIDEPGLFLHAKAQKDVLGRLEDCSNNTQIIFSTHSPYLLEPDKLDRIRLVLKRKTGGTIVHNKIHALADKETLTPILTAIGLELNDGIQNIDRINNVVVEGPSDVFYLQAFLLLSSKEHNAHFIYGGGAGNMPIVGTILQGWGCSVIYLFDNDQGKRDGADNLNNNWYVTKDLIELISGNEGSIEDIFNTDDFKKYVLGNESINYTSTNSEYLKKPRKDKVLFSRLFLQKVQKKEITIDVLNKDTVKNIEQILDKVDDKFE